MKKDYDVENILSEIKAKKSRQTSSATVEKIQPRSDFQIDRKEKFAQADPPPKARTEAPAFVEPSKPPTKDILRDEPARGNPTIGSSAFFSGFDAPDEALFRPGKKPTSASEGKEKTGASVYQKYFDKMQEETESFDEPILKFEEEEKAYPEKEKPSKEKPTEDLPLFGGDSAFEGDFTFGAGNQSGEISNGADLFHTTTFQKQASKPKEIQEEPEQELVKPGKFRLNIEEDMDIGSGSQPLSSKFGDTAPPLEEAKRKNLFFKGRKDATDHTGSFTRLNSSDVPVPDDFAENVDGDIEDYSTPEDKEAILKDMKSIKFGLLLRVGLLAVVFGISMYLSLAARDIVVGGNLLPLPTIMQPEKHIRTYMVVSTLMAALAALICSNTVGGGLLALLKFHANTDTLPALASIGTIAQGICYIVKPEFFQVASLSSNLYLFFPVAIFVLLFNVAGKITVILRIQNNFKLVASDKSKLGVAFLKDKKLLRELTKGLSMEEYTIAYPEKSKFLSGFLDNSYSEDHAESMSRILAPLCLLAGVLLAVLSYLFNKDIPVAITTFTAVMCICAPLTSTLAANYPLLRLSQKLIPLGAMVSGYSAVESFSQTEAVVMNASDIFRPENVVLHGIKAFDEGKIDAVILDAASVVCSTNGMLTSVFSKIIGANKAMLKPVENVAYEDSMGLSAWVDGKRVLIGNRELMQNHGIEVPSNDYEMRFVKDSKNIIYLSNSGVLSAMFVISYNPNSEVQEELDKLAGKGMYLFVDTSDPNITAEKIRDAYTFPIEQVRLLPAKYRRTYLELTAEKTKASAKMAFLGSTKSMIKAIYACMKVKASIEQSVLIQMVALVVGYGLVALFSLMGNLPLLSIMHLLLFQSLWAVIGIVIPNLKKY